MTLETVAMIGGWHRDVRLHGTSSPWRLTVDLHVRFTTFSDHINARGDDVRPWRDDERDAFKRNFASAVENAWSHKWLLMPARGSRGVMCEHLDWCDDAPQPVDVTLRVRDRDRFAPSASHVSVNEIRVAGVPLDFSAEDRGTVYLSLGDNQADPSPDGNLQVASAHEAGHLLGLSHPGDRTLGAVCAPRSDLTPQPPECYRDSLGEARMIMGTGMYVRRADYRPFAVVMNGESSFGRNWECGSRRIRTRYRYYVSSRRPDACPHHPHAGDYRTNPGGQIREFEPPS